MAEMLSSGTGSLRTFHLHYKLTRVCPVNHYSESKFKVNVVVSFDAEENWDGLIIQCKTNVCTVDTDRMVDHCS